MSYPYSNAYQPPAPVLDIEILHPGASATSVVLTAEVDTGADITVIPQAFLFQLQVPPSREVIAIGYNGEETRQQTYLVHLTVAGKTYAYQEVLTIPENQPLLGRDILNRWIVTLDGPGERLDVETDNL